MIHDPEIEVTCDADSCADSTYVSLDYVYNDWSGKTGHYDTSDGAIEKALESQNDWIVKNGQHFCCEQCAGSTDE